jgi:hypothetical protein
MTSRLLSSGKWVVECHDCYPYPLKIPALNQKDANDQIDLHRRIVAEKEKEKRESSDGKS